MNQAAFLGPRAENAHELEELLLEVLHDHVGWRRSFHPEDPGLVGDAQRAAAPYQEASRQIRAELTEILADLKRGTPLHSPRQIGHMVSDPTLPAVVGYFAGLLYNQNNVVGEAAPETLRKEGYYIAALARMVGYPPLLPESLDDALDTGYSWGHLCSGGTVANMEALWVARNVRLYPLALRVLAATDPAFGDFGEMAVTTASGRVGPLSDTKTFDLLNVPTREVTRLHIEVQGRLRAAGRERAEAYERAFPSVRHAGLAGMMQTYNAAFPTDKLRPPLVLASRAAHYGWPKGLDVVGLGAASLETLPVDDSMRLDVDALEAALRSHAEGEQAVLMVVGICGTTEVGAVDPLNRLDVLRTDMESAGMTFWLHADAAYGGYLASLLSRDDQGKALAYASTERAHQGVISESVYDAVAALSGVDSFSIDPHKWGYVPYPAGAVLFRDHRVRDAAAYAAPYLPADDAEGFSGFVGRWTMEGSRPGASAVGAYLSQKVVPLVPSGHGELVANCIQTRKELVAALESRFADGPVSFRLLAEPDSAGVCFVLVPRGFEGRLADLNAYTRDVLGPMLVDGREDVSSYPFILSKTELLVSDYRSQLARVLPGDLAQEHGTVLFFRAFTLNPFTPDWNAKDGGIAARFAEHVGRLAESRAELGRA